MKTLSITIEETLVEALDQGILERSLKGRSEAIREAVREWVKQNAHKKKLRREIEGYRKKPVEPDEFSPIMNLQDWPA